MSKRWIVMLLAMVAAGCTNMATHKAEEEDEGKEVKIDFSQAPEAAQNTLRREAQGATIKTLDQETHKDGKVYYEADVKIEGTNYEIVVNADGKLIHKKIDQEDNEKQGKDSEKEKD